MKLTAGEILDELPMLPMCTSVFFIYLFCSLPVSSAYSTPPLSSWPIMKKIKDVYDEVIKLTKDPSKRYRLLPPAV